MAKQVSKKTYRIVHDRDGGMCQHPDCGTTVGVEYHHILFRSATQGALEEVIDDPDAGVMLCGEHHRTGKEAPHRSRKWKVYYYNWLPDRLLPLIGDKGLELAIKKAHNLSPVPAPF